MGGTWTWTCRGDKLSPLVLRKFTFECVNPQVGNYLLQNDAPYQVNTEIRHCRNTGWYY